MTLERPPLKIMSRPVILALTFVLAACDEELVGPGWWDRLLAASGAPPSQEKWTAIRPYRFAHDTLTIRVGQRIAFGLPCWRTRGLPGYGWPECNIITSAADTAEVATWTKGVALTTCARNPEPECSTRTEPTWVWGGDPPPWVPWEEAVDSGFVAVTDRATLEGLLNIVPGCQGGIEPVEPAPSGGAILAVQSCLLIEITHASHGGAVDRSCLPNKPPPDVPDHVDVGCSPGYIGREPGWGWFESTMQGGAGNPLFTDTVAVQVVPNGT